METSKVVDVSVRRGWPALRSVSTPYLSRLWVPVYIRTYHVTSGCFETNIVSLGTLWLQTVNLVNLAAMKLDLRLATKPFGWKATRRDRSFLCGLWPAFPEARKFSCSDLHHSRLRICKTR